MPKFGQHETAQRLHLSGVGSLFALAADDKKIVKVLQPPPGIWTEDQLRFEIDAFLLRYKTQRLITKASKHWAPVHEVSAIRAGTEGSTDGIGGDAASRAEDSQGFYIASGAYAVLDRYERSVQSLLDGRVKVDNSDLRNIFTGVLQGLLDCRGAMKRPHGNIKPANILLKDSANLSTATVHLTDPAADASLTLNSDKKDLADIGKILYELVNLRPFAGGTIGRSKEWDRLGPNGEDWRNSAAAFLDAGGGSAPADERDLEKLLPKIATWTAKPKKSKAPLIAAAVFLLLIAGGITTFILLKPPKPKWDEGKWDELCLASHAWFYDFYVDASPASEMAKLNASPGLPRTAVDLLTDALKKRAAKTDYYLPVEIAQDNSGAEIRQLIAMPTNEAKLHPGPARTLVALKLTQDLQAALKPEGWPLLATLKGEADTYEKDRHWQQPADDLRVIMGATQPPEIPTTGDPLSRYDAIKPRKNLLHALKNAVSAGDAVTNIDTAWAAIDTNIKTIKGLESASHADVPILRDLAGFARALPTAGSQPAKPKDMSADDALTDVQGFAAKLQPAADTLASIATVLTKDKINLTELAKAGESQLAPSIDNYIAFAARVPDYVVIPDPRHASAWESDVNEINGIIDVIQQTAPQDPEIAALKNELEKLQQTIQQTSALPLIALNKNKLAASVDAIEKTTYPALLTRGMNNPNYIDPKKEKTALAATLANPPKEIAAASPVVLDHWKQAQQKLIDAFSTLDDTTFRHQFRREIPKRLLAAYADLEKQLSPRVPALDLKTGAPWQSKIAGLLASRLHDEALTTLVNDYTAQYSPDKAPDLQDPAYQSFVQAHLQTYNARCDSGRRFIDGYAAIENALNGLYLNRDEPARGAPYWSDLATQLAAAEFLHDPQVGAALKESGLTDRIANLQSLVAATDYPKIEPALAADAAELVLTAWRKLAAIQLPESATYLDTEEKTQQHLAGMLQKLPDPARAQQLSAELSAGIPQHWHHWANALTTPELIGVALARRPKDAQLRPGEDDRLIYNESLYELNRNFTSSHAITDFKTRDEALKKATLAFIASAQNLPASVKELAAFDKLLVTFKKPLEAKAADLAASAIAGPKLVGWEMVADNEGNFARFYFPDAAHHQFTLEFRKLPDQDEGRIVYLCTTELPVELFAQVLNEPTPRAPALNKPNWFNITDDGYIAWHGVRSWQIAGSTVGPNSDWLFPTPNMAKHLSRPQGAKPFDPPGPQTPVQAISPYVALYTARLLGCRLPTAAEWTSAYKAFESQPGPKDWNLRGADFDIQKKHVEGINAVDLDVGWPFPDAFAFEPVGKIQPRGAKALIWLPDDLVKLAPDALTRANADTIIANSTLWFRKVPPPTATGVPPMHDLVGNVAEFTFDSPTATKALTAKDVAPTPATIEPDIDAGTLSVVGGSSISSPLIPFNVPQKANAPGLPFGRADVGMRLAYTAPIASIESVLANFFASPKYLPAPSHNAASLLQP